MTHTASFLCIIRNKLWRRAALIGALGGLAFAGFYVVQRIEWGVVFGPIIGDSDILENSAINGRGDRVLAITDAAKPKDPDKTDIRIRPEHNWFWIPLLRSESYGMHINFKWSNDEMLVVNLDFGCFIHMTHPVERVGPIHVIYHFTYNDPTLDLDLARSGVSSSSACKRLHSSG
jgi:hypothetical protein